MGLAIRAGFIAVAAALLGGCASGPPKSRELVVLVPDRDGKVGSVVVNAPQGTTTLDKPYTAVRMDEGRKADAPAAVSHDELKKRFASAIAFQPIRPISFQLYFQEGTDEYTQESKEAFERVFAEVARRKVAEVAVIGHTDTVGKGEFNDMLSLKRAERVRNDFVNRGIPTSSINVAGRGEREPVVLTSDEVNEPRNRRVEINVR